MSETAFIILSISIFSIFEAFIMFNCLINKKYSRLFENAIVYIVIVLFLCYKNSLHIQIYNFIMILFIITILGHTFIGEYLDFYHKSKKYDRYLHLLGSFSFSLFAYSVIESIVKPVSYSKIYVALYVAALGISIGVIFELVEFTFDTLAKKDKYEKNQHGLLDTDFDLFFNVIGAVIAGFVSIYLF